MKHLLPEIKQPASKHPITPADLLDCEIAYTGDLCTVGIVTKNQVDYAVKMIRKELISGQFEAQVKNIQNQITTLYQCQHPNIIELLGHFETEEDIVLVFPYFGQTMDDFIKSIKKKTNKKIFTFDNFVFIFHQLASAIFELQVKGFVHRDISSDNILINEDHQIKLIDFGYVNSNNRLRKTKIGTLMYLAPEIMQGKPYNHKVDVWALGILCYQLLYGVYLFRPKGKGLSEQQIEKEYVKNMMKPIEEYPAEKLLVDEEPPEEMLTEIKCMLSYNPDKRPEIGYLLTRQIFGAARRDSETYDLKEYIRKRTERKPHKTNQKGSENIKEMSIGELEETLISLISQHTFELSRSKQLLLHLVKAEQRLQDVRSEKLAQKFPE